MSTPTWSMQRPLEDKAPVCKVKRLFAGAIGLTAYSVWASGLPEAASGLSERWSGVGAIFLLLLCGLAGWFVWFKRRSSQPDSAYRLKVVGGISLGPKERLLIVKLNERVLVLGVTNHQVNLIKDLPESDFKLDVQTAAISSLEESE